MGWFSRNNEQPTSQFGAANSGYGGMSPYGAGGGMGMGAYGGMQGMQQNGMMMDPYAMQQMGQNPMMQQMANDPVVATHKLLQYYDPVSDFLVSVNFPMMMDLFSEILTLSLKDFFQNVKLTTDEDGKISLDTATLPTNINTLSPENLALSLQQLQTSAQQTLQMNNQQTQMLLQAHNPLLNNQSGFFGNMLGGLLGNTMQQQGGLGAMGAAGMALV